MSRRRIHVAARDERVVLAIGVLSGIGLGLRGLSPTGSTVIDWVVLILASTGVVWAAASAPWWALSATAAIAAALVDPWLPLLIGLGVFGLSLAVGATRSSQPVERAVVAGATLLVFSMARELGRFGVNTYVVVIICVALAGFGLRRRSRRIRRTAYLVISGCAAVLGVGTVAFVIAGSSARPDLTAGERAARQGLRELKATDFESAQTSFDRASEAFARADGDVGAWWVAPARLVPVVSQHQRAVTVLSDEAAVATATVSSQLSRIDFDALRLVDGQIDLDAVAGLQEPMQELQVALDSLDEAVIDAQNPWLVQPLQDRLDELQVEVAEQRDLGDKAVVALDRAPAILGADGERHYFIMFTTPAEARGQGGFMGNYAEITVDDGRISLTDFGRTGDLRRAAGGEFDLTGAPADWLEQYGAEGFARGPGRPVVDDVWSIFTISPHFPSTARVTDILYPQSGGVDLHGVFNLDVYALQELVGLVGEITIEDRAEPLTGENTADYLLIEQYELSQGADRVDQLEVIAREVTDRLLGSSPPEPIDLGRGLAPMVDERRVMGWLEQPEEEALLSLVGMDGAVHGERGGSDAITVAINNDGSGKMDTYLERSIRYETTAEGDEITIDIVHAAPVDELPDYVTTPPSGEPRGYGRWLVTVYSTRSFANAWLDGEEIGLDVGGEAGLATASTKIVLPPGRSTTLRLRLLPSTSADQTRLVVQPQPLVQPERWTVLDEEPGVISTTTTFVR